MELLENSENAINLIKTELEKQLKALKQISPNSLVKMSPFANLPEEEKLIILADIVGFSNRDTREQVFGIYLFQRYLSKLVLENRLSFAKNIEVSSFVPTGDGCYIIAKKCEESKALDFLVALVSGFSKFQDEDGRPLSLRVSALMGKCVPFIDLTHHKNYIGEGMNEAARLLSGGQAALEAEFKKRTGLDEHSAHLFSRNSLYLGDSLRTAGEEFSSRANELIYFEAVQDKHGRTRNITVLQGVR